LWRRKARLAIRGNKKDINIPVKLMQGAIRTLEARFKNDPRAKRRCFFRGRHNNIVESLKRASGIAEVLGVS
jgi:hypothetical protein